MPQKTSHVTGAGSGIGLAISRLIASQGAFVRVADRDVHAGTAAVEAIRAAGGRADFAGIDMSDPVAAQALTGRLPPLDILVNNAGIGHVGNLMNSGAADLDRLHAVKVRGPFNLCKAFVPALLARGRIISISAVDLPDGRDNLPQPVGGVAEWSIAAVLKTAEPQGSGGSNPSPTATFLSAQKEKCLP